MSRKVLASIDSPDASHCVDIFLRDDGSHGFEEFRAEFDGAARWQSLGRHGTLRYDDGPGALAAAKERIDWLDPALTWRW